MSEKVAEGQSQGLSCIGCGRPIRLTQVSSPLGLMDRIELEICVRHVGPRNEKCDEFLALIYADQKQRLKLQMQQLAKQLQLMMTGEYKP